MNVFSLEEDEFAIECLLRDIPDDDPNKTQTLQDLVLAEEAGTQAKPNKMHKNAARHPDIEIKSCRTKLKSLQRDIDALATLDTDDQVESAKIIEARLMHVTGRLLRATTSPTYGTDAESVLVSSQVLLSSLRLYLNDGEKLNESINAAKAVNLDSRPTSEGQNVLLKRDDQATYEMTCLMEQVQQLSKQVADLSKPRIDERAQAKNEIAIAAAEAVNLDAPAIAKVLNALPKRDVQASYAMTCLMDQVQQLAKQVAELGKKRIDEKAECENEIAPAAAKVKFSEATYVPTQPTDLSPIFPPRFDMPPPSIRGIHKNNALPANHYSSCPIAELSGTHPQFLNSSYYLPPVAPTLHQMPAMTNNDSKSIPPSTMPPTQYMNTDVQPSHSWKPDLRGLSRSGLSFDGSPTGTPINLFLFQLETLATSMKIDNDKLLTEMSVVLKGIAAHWYWTYRQQNPWIKWPELKDKMIERFKNRRPDSDIENEIESRTQRATQSFLEFYQEIWSLTIQLSVPYSDQQLMKILRKNMKPGLRYQLTDRQFSNIGELISSCTSWENTWTDLKIDPDSFILGKREVQSAKLMTPRPVINELQGDMNQPYYNMIYADPNYPNYSVPQVAAMRQPITNTHNALYSDRSLTDKIDQALAICFNCDDIGHIFKFCPIAPTRPFCYKCGMKDTITPRCIRCAENYQRGQWRTGTQGTPKYSQPGPIANSQPPLNQHLPQNHQP